MSELTSVIQSVSKYAPLIGAVLPIPGASIIGNAIGALFGGSIEKPEELASKISADPDAEIKLKTIEANMEIQLHQIIANQAISQTQSIVQDKINARNMQIETKSKTPNILAFLVTLGFFSLLGFLCEGNIPQENVSVLNIMLGSLGGSFITIIAFYFGSSSSSEAKTKMLFNSTPTGKNTHE